ncbi:uncharacterized protein PV06_10264 [Exophiala oligosperma]|uniref:Uncharacterized protein n=1 Tax=Exophiala oligosperma TaxID=215243 RepID=A0A0D2D2S9_9EURO|nr:uncharacterized protein PV06_10264 [Exophiala oligosperma]KIW37623.1 hypothetical protein PV06_10264 [Exophiala oligosperma]
MSEPQELAVLRSTSLRKEVAVARAPPVAVHKLRTAVARRDGKGKQYLLNIRDGQSGGEIMQMWNDMEVHSKFVVWWHKILAMRPAIFEGTVTMQNDSDLEAERISCFIAMGTLQELPQHTFAYSKPGEFLSWAGFVHDNARFYQAANGGFGMQKALILAWKTDKLLVGVITAILTLVSIAIGIIIGMACHNAGLGIGVSATIFTLLAFLAFVLNKSMKYAITPFSAGRSI